MSVRVKICGIRSLEGAKAALDAGTDFIGFNFIPTSRRCISEERALEIADALRGKIVLVGVFQNQPLAFINETIGAVGLDYVQLHGDEDNAFCRNVGAKVIKAFRLPSNPQSDETSSLMKRYAVEYYMVDRQVQGSGSMLDLEHLAILAKEFPLFVAGGLTPQNVAEVARIVRPFAVDVASGIETEGREDTQKIKRFIQEAKGGQK